MWRSAVRESQRETEWLFSPQRRGVAGRRWGEPGLETCVTHEKEWKNSDCQCCLFTVSTGQGTSNKHWSAQQDHPGDHPEQPVCHIPGRNKALLHSRELHKCTGHTHELLMTLWVLWLWEKSSRVWFSDSALLNIDDPGSSCRQPHHPLGRQVVQFDRVLRWHFWIHLWCEFVCVYAVLEIIQDVLRFKNFILLISMSWIDPLTELDFNCFAARPIWCHGAGVNVLVCGPANQSNRRQMEGKQWLLLVHKHEIK